MTVLWIVVTVFLMALAVDLFFILPTQWLKVERVKWTRRPNTKILQISDLHIERNRVTDKILRVVAQEQPDYIFLTGDYLDSLKAMPKLKRFFERMNFYHIPSYAVLGNHDYLLDDLTPLLQLMKESGVRMLRNESVSLPEFELIGIDDFCTDHADIHAAFHQTEPHRFIYVITHDPTVVLSIERSYDALIGGHLHGKQFNLPFLFALQPMGPLAAKGIYKGVHSSPYGDYYISKGAGQSGYNARLFVRSEITLHFF